MKFNNIALKALEYVLPSQIVTSRQIESEISTTMQRLKLPAGLLESLSGIKERRIWPVQTRPSEAATSAAIKAIEVSGIDSGEIGCVINTSVCRDYVEPSVACIVHGNLKLSPYCLNFDISNACLGFFNAIELLASMIEKKAIKYGLIVDGETSGELLASTIARLKQPQASLEDYKSNFASLTLGSAGVAAIIGSSDSTADHTVNGLVSLADTRYADLCVGQRDYMESDAATLMKKGVDLAFRTWKLAETELKDWSDDLIDFYVPHQVSLKNTEMLNLVLRLSAQKQELIFMEHGNMGPAAVPVALKMAEEAGRLSPRHHIGLLGIGSGLNCSMMSITW